jgi:hypothetical protein
MESQFNFYTEKIINGQCYPALAKHSAKPYTPEWREFVRHYPFTTPNKLIDYCDEHNFKYTINKNPRAYYIITLGFFDFTIDYFSLIDPSILNNYTVLFYYHEGEDPYLIKARLDSLCLKNNLNKDCYYFISGNKSASAIDNFVYFPDHELLYWQQNKNTPALKINLQPRTRDFTVLSRRHNWARAAIVADLRRNNILENSYWSYNIIDPLTEDYRNYYLTGPIQINRSMGHLAAVADLIKNAPFSCDELDSTAHNDHSQLVSEHFTNSYCNIVLETLYTGGPFLSEKTFKPIKHGQPFVLAGPAGSLQLLRDLGYRVFDTVIDNSYDLIENDTQRWYQLLETIKKIKNTTDKHKWLLSLVPDIVHNQQLFVASKTDRLNNLLERLQ